MDYLSTANEAIGHYRKGRCNDNGEMCTVPPISGLPVQKWLTSSGDGLGTYNLNGNYSTPTDFYYLTSSLYDIYSLIIAITDGTTFNYNDYGGIPTGTITNGVKLFIYKASILTEVPLLSGIAIKNNYEYLSVTSDVKLTQFAGTPQTMVITFHLKDEYGQPLHLDIGDKVIIRLQDNFTGLLSHTFGIRGIKQ